jgi:hypothetical protein
MVAASSEKRSLLCGGGYEAAVPETKILFLGKTLLKLQTLPSGDYRGSRGAPAHLVEVCRRVDTAD